MRLPVTIASMGSHRAILVYDGTCGMCRRTERLVRAFDWLRRIDSMPFVDAASAMPEVAATSLEEGVRLQLADGRVLIGIDAVRGVMVQTPVGLLPGMLLFLPGLRQAGAALYRRVAARRATAATCRVDEARRS